MRTLVLVLLVLPFDRLVAQSPPPPPGHGQAIQALNAIDRGCHVYPADTLTLAAARERYGVGCYPVLDPKAEPWYGFARPARPYGRIVLSLSDTGAVASIHRLGTKSERRGVPVRLPGGRGGGFAFDSVAAGSYDLLATIDGRTTRVAPIQIREGELWELFYVPIRDH